MFNYTYGAILVTVVDNNYTLYLLFMYAVYSMQLLVIFHTGMFPVGDTSSGTLIAVCVCVCQCVRVSVCQSVRRHIAILRQE